MSLLNWLSGSKTRNHRDRSKDSNESNKSTCSAYHPRTRLKSNSPINQIAHLNPGRNIMFLKFKRSNEILIYKVYIFIDTDLLSKNELELLEVQSKPHANGNYNSI